MKRVFAAVLAVLSILLTVACAAPNAPAEEPAPEASVLEAPVEGQPAAEEPEAAALTFSLTTLQGEAIDEAYFAEHTLTMVNYWATWCGPCVGEIPDLITIADEYADKGFAILGVLFGDTDVEGAKSFIEAEGVNYPVVNADGVFAEMGRSFSGIPTTLFVDANGRVLADPVVGSRSAEDWKAIIDGLLAAVG